MLRYGIAQFVGSWVSESGYHLRIKKVRKGRASVDFLDPRGAPVQRPYMGGAPHKRFYEKVIKVKADVAALRCLISVFSCVWQVSSTVPPFLDFFTFLVLGGFRHISTENLALGSLRSDDWQLGRPTVPPPFCLCCRETLLVFFRAALSSGNEAKRSSVELRSLVGVVFAFY